MLIYDEIRITNWLQTKDAQTGTNRPDPLSPLRKPTKTVYGGTDLSDEEAIELLSHYGPANEE